MDDFAVLVHFDDPAVPAFRNHREIVGEALEGVDLDGASIAFLWPGHMGPDDLLLRGHFDNGRAVRGKKNIPVGQEREVVDIGLRRASHSTTP